MSTRARILALTVLAAGVVAGVVVAVAVGQRGPEGKAPDPSANLPKGAPPLALDLGLRADPEAVALRRAATLYDRSLSLDGSQPARAARVRGTAGAMFRRWSSLDARVGGAFASWPGGTIDAIEKLAGLHPRSAVVQLNLGIARLWAGRPLSDDALQTAADLAPDTSLALTAGNLLFPAYLPNLPRFVPSVAPPAAIGGVPPGRQLQALERLAEKGDRTGGVYYALVLTRLGHPVSAQRAADRLARIFPNDVEVLTAAAVAHFDKQNPSAAFGRLGPLSRRFPRAATVRFHLGLLLLWSKQIAPARKQLERAILLAPDSSIAGQARRYLATLDGAAKRPR